DHRRAGWVECFGNRSGALPHTTTAAAAAAAAAQSRLIGYCFDRRLLAAFRDGLLGGLQRDSLAGFHRLTPLTTASATAAATATATRLAFAFGTALSLL